MAFIPLRDRIRIRFVYIYKAKRRKRKTKTDTIKQCYCIAMLDDHNIFYYDQYRCLSTSVLNHYVLNNLRSRFRRYLFDSKTHVCFSEDIGEYEFIKLFFQTTRLFVNFNLSSADLPQMLKQINLFHNFHKVKPGPLTRVNQGLILKRLIDRGKIPWLSADIMLKYDNMSLDTRRKYVIPSVGVYYLMIKEQNHINDLVSIDRRRRKEEQSSNLT